MSQELLSILEQMEREKGIKKEILVETVEAAVLSAARKVIDVKPGEDLSVSLDRNTGKIHAYIDKAGDKHEVDSMDFGRIAASTARQVIIQKIREAEKEIIFSEFQGKVGEIVSGVVYRFEKGNIVIDLLGKAEGLLLRREQSPKEDYRQGQRVRAFILEVKKESKGAQIILSRTHPNLIKKLFELEVPEIYEGIVEIKAVARQPGERTKIAVCSKNEKVDSVGACVGMRGNRVRNIVNEIQGEKIDIVRYSDDIREYIRAALSPAKISEIKMDKEHQKAEVIVDDDQLSLAIGKHGQNVRLASRLIGWELDIRTKQPPVEEAEEEEAQAEKGAKEKKPKKAKKKKTKEAETKAKKPVKKEGASLDELSGIGEKTLENLKGAGFNSVEDLLSAGVEGLVKVKGIGKTKAEKIIADIKK